MIRLRFTRADLLGTRFSLAPLWEAAAAFRAVRYAPRTDPHVSWLSPVVPLGRSLDPDPLPSLLPAKGYAPDFITPPPVDVAPRPAAEFARLRDTPLDIVTAELTRVAAPSAVRSRLLADPALARRRIATALRLVWDRLLARDWQRIADLLEADIAHRSMLIARDGLRTTLTSLHPDITWSGDELLLPGDGDDTVDLDGRGLLLVPSALSWADPGLQTDPPWQPTLIYPARGTATLHHVQTRSPDALAALLGHTRATVLAALDRPRTTTELARDLRLSPATVSGHLTVLRRAGLASARRTGREVHYRRTPLGKLMLAGHGLPPADAD